MTNARPLSRHSLRVQRLFLLFLGMVTPCKAATLYALYNIPSCTIILDTTAVDSLPNPLSNGLLSETNGHNSGLSYPLRLATQNFLLEEFERKIGLLETQANAQDPTMLYPWFPMYAHLVGVDLVLQVFLVETRNGDDEQNTRRLQSTPTATLRVEMVGSLAFEEPRSAASKPPNDQVALMFGQWMESIFSTQRGSYWNAIMASNQDVLEQAVIVEITTMGVTKNARYGGGGGTDTTMTQERTQRILLSLLLLVCSVGVIYSIYALRRHKYKHTVRQLIHAHMDGGGGGGYTDGDDGEYNFSGSVKEPSDGMDAIRHGSDIIYAHRSAQSVLDNTDRYLSKHRPDLYSDSNHDHASMSSSNMSSTTSSSNIQVFGREYTIPSNPFGILYSAFNQETKFEASPQGAFTPRRGSVIEEQHTNNLAAVRGFEDDETTATPLGPSSAAFGSRSREFEDEHYHDDEDDHRFSPHRGVVAFRPISSIWRNFTQMWDSERRENHGGVFMEAHPSDLELQTGQFQYQDNLYPLDETPDYDFAFKDFPRHDGTPCLIFNDNGVLLTPRQREVFAIDSPHTSPTNHMDKDTMPVSDEAFQRMLAAQGADQRSGSPDDSLFLESSFACDEIVDTSATEASSTTVPPQFKEELARLYEQKFRQYEKKAIVEKHQERREKERKSQREQERRERHKVMEGTIEDLEGAIGTTPRWQASQSSPKPYHYSPNQHPHRANTHSPKAKYSPYRTGHHHSDNISRASPATRKTMLDWDRELANGSAAVVGSGSRSLAEEPFRMRPRTMQSHGGAVSDVNFLASHLSATTIDHSTLDKLSLPPMTSTKKYSPNAVMDDIFGGAPTSISRRKSNTGSTTTTSSVTAPGNSKVSHRRVNSFDHKAVLGYERPLPQQRRRPKATGPGTSTPRTRSRTPTRTLTPTRIGHQQGRQMMNFSHLPSGDLTGGSSVNSSASMGAPRRRRSASPAPRGDVFTHGVVAQTRLV